MLAGLGPDRGQDESSALAASQHHFPFPESQPQNLFPDAVGSQPGFVQRSPAKFFSFSQPAHTAASQQGGQSANNPAMPPPPVASNAKSAIPRWRPEAQLLAPRRRLIAPQPPKPAAPLAMSQAGPGHSNLQPQGIRRLLSNPLPANSPAVSCTEASQPTQQQLTAVGQQLSQPGMQAANLAMCLVESSERTQQPELQQQPAFSLAAHHQASLRLSEGMTQPAPSQLSNAKAAAAAKAAALLERLAQKSAIEEASGETVRKLEEVSCQCRGIGASVEAVHGKVEAHEKTLRDVSNTCQQMLGMLQALGLAERTQEQAVPLGNDLVHSSPQNATGTTTTIGASGDDDRCQKRKRASKQRIGKENLPSKAAADVVRPDESPKHPGDGKVVRQPRRGRRNSKAPPLLRVPPSGNQAGSGELGGNSRARREPENRGPAIERAGSGDAIDTGKNRNRAKRRRAAAAAESSAEPGSKRQGRRRQPGTVSALRRFLEGGGSGAGGSSEGRSVPIDEQELNRKITRRLERHRAKWPKQDQQQK